MPVAASRGFSRSKIVCGSRSRRVVGAERLLVFQRLTARMQIRRSGKRHGGSAKPGTDVKVTLATSTLRSLQLRTARGQF
jgi:hypothetical protein